MIRIMGWDYRGMKGRLHLPYESRRNLFRRSGKQYTYNVSDNLSAAYQGGSLIIMLYSDRKRECL
jgi:hypothetical protein